MGFFTNIIRDSKRSIGSTATDRSVRMTPAATGSSSGLSDPQEHVVSWNNSLNPIEETSKAFWEEEVGQNGAARAQAQPSDLEDRQVVGPSPLENTDDSDLAKAPEDKRSSPVIGKRKQIGLKNRRDVTVQPWMRRDRNLHGLASFGKEVFSSEDSSVVKPVSKRPEQRARGKSVEVTHRSRQAGQIARAGATTPPNPITPDGTASIRSRPASKVVGKQPAPEEGRASPTNIVTPFETGASQAKWLESQGGRGETPALTSPAGIENGGSAVPADQSANEAADQKGWRTFEPSTPERAAMAANQADIPVQRPVEFFFPDAKAPEPFQADPRETSTSPGVTQPPVHEPSSPKVHIGFLEVVVLAPGNPPSRKTSRSPDGHNFASRHYLRNL